MAYVNLSKMPSAKREYVISFERLSGGLNLKELDYRIGNDESPEMKNMLWRDGVLGSRDGQLWVDPEDTGVDGFVTAFSALWHDRMFIHAGTKLYAVDPETGERTALYNGESDMTIRGTFFLYNQKLYYKTRGYYVEIEFKNDAFTADDVEAYIPVTYINCAPLNGSGTVYQPENFISPSKELWYNAEYNLNVECSTYDVLVSVESAYFRTKITQPGTYVFVYNNGWTLDGVAVDPLDYGLHITGELSNGTTITATFSYTNRYYLPIDPESLTKITVDGQQLTPEEVEIEVIEVNPGSLTAAINPAVWRQKVTDTGHNVYDFVYDYDHDPSSWMLDNVAVDLNEYGITVTGTPETGDVLRVDFTHGDYYLEGQYVYFYDAPKAYYPEINNTVHVQYSVENPTAMANIMDCTIAAVYGGTGSLCIVMAGSTTQPNAYFWNGQTSTYMDPGYFPMTQYQLASDATDPITVFGKQQGYLIIFKEGSVGRTTLGTAEVDGRMTIDLPYVAINNKIGCDLPNTVQLIENNLTWCNKSQGIHFLANTSSAYENNIICISDKVNDSIGSWNAGLLYDLRNAKSVITSHDDEKRYWLVLNGHAWLWDYYISNYKDPAWFFFDNIQGAAFVQDLDKTWHFDSNSRLTKFVRSSYYDYDPDEGAIDKVFRFATQFFGSYDSLKTVNEAIITTRSDTVTNMELTYLTDYEQRKDLSDLIATSWRLVPRDLTHRNLEGSGFAKVFKRKPHCRRIRYFTMRLENNQPRHDMTVVSAQIFYVFNGRQR